MTWVDRIRSWATQRDEERYTMNDWLSWQGFPTYSRQGPIQTLTGETVEPADGTFEGNTTASFTQNPVIFACMSLRAHVFSAIRFQWQLMVDGRHNMLFGNEQLEILERPWFGGTTQDLLNRVITDADLAGTCYLTTGLDLNGRREIIRLRPDWVDVLMEPVIIRGAQAGWRKLGWAYWEGGRNSGNDPVIFTVGDSKTTPEVATFTPMIDPLANWRGMSWLTPVIREVQADALMVTHRRKFFENGATPNMIIRYPATAKISQIKEMKKILEPEHAGVENAYKRLYIGGGADVTVVGTDFQKMDFKTVQGGGETRIAAAAGTPVVLVGLSEGLQGSSLNSGNYQQARRRMADITAHPLWQNISGSLAILLGTPPPPRSAKVDLGPRDTGAVRLWYDARDVPFLREDEKDAAEIRGADAATMRQLLDGGFEPESVVAAILAEDFGLLKHTGMFSVQLQPPGTVAKPIGAAPEQPAITTGPPKQQKALPKAPRHNRPGDHPSGAARKGLGVVPIDSDLAAGFANGSASPHLRTASDGRTVFTPERQALHDRLVTEALGDATPVANPEFTIMGGGPGSGKTTLVKSGKVRVLNEKNVVMTNADDFKAKLPEYNAMIKSGDKSAAAFSHEESSYLVRRTQAAALERGLNFTLDGTGNGTPSHMEARISAARSAGYKVNGIYVSIPTNVAVARAEARGQRSGRFVPETFLRKSHSNVSNTYAAVHPKFDTAEVYDMTEKTPKLLSSWDGKSLNVADQDGWNAFLAKGSE